MTKTIFLLPLAALALSACQTLDPYGNQYGGDRYGGDPTGGGGYPTNDGYGNQGYGNQGYGDQGYGDQGYPANPANQPYGDNGYGQNGNGDNGYNNNGYGNDRYGDAAGNAAYDARPLAGTRWALLSINGMSAEGRAAMLNFDGRGVSGSTGCNSFNADYVLDGMAISFGPARTTRMACAPRLMGQERAMLDLLSAAEAQPVGDRYRRLGAVRYAPNGNMILSAPDGRAAVFAPAY